MLDCRSLFGAPNEALYHGLLHIAFTLVGMHTQSEVHTKNGRCDMAIKAGGVMNLIEFKFDQTAQAAMNQIKSKGYAAHWQAQGHKVTAFGINIDKASKTVSEVIVASLNEK